LKKQETKKQQIVLKTTRGLSRNCALSIHTPVSPSETRDTVPLKGLFHRIFHLWFYASKYPAWFLVSWPAKSRLVLMYRDFLTQRRSYTVALRGWSTFFLQPWADLLQWLYM
jgi:hypothetical protein